MTVADHTLRRLSELVDRVERNERSIGVLSTGERIAVALVLNRTDLLPDTYPHVLHAVDRLDDYWLEAAIEIAKQR